MKFRATLFTFGIPTGDGRIYNKDSFVDIPEEIYVGYVEDLTSMSSALPITSMLGKGKLIVTDTSIITEFDSFDNIPLVSSILNPMWEMMRLASYGQGMMNEGNIISNYSFNYLYCRLKTPDFPSNLELVTT